jgi:predicted  nucleic acid-binding Zn-ribbon protein
LIKVTTLFQENLSTLRRDFDGFKADGETLNIRIHELDKQLARLEESQKHSDKELEKLRSSRFEIGKLLLAACLGAAFSYGVNMLTSLLKR